MDCSEFNRLIDGYIDGELDEAQRIKLQQHAAQCPECKGKLADAEQLRDILSHLNDDISVPLPAQAAWRNAVKEEARRRRMKRVWSACGAVAAAFVLMMGVTAMLRPDNGVVVPNTPRVETDGVSAAADESAHMKSALMSARVRSIEYIERRISTDDPEKTYEYLCDVIAEYGGMIERENDGDEKKVFVQIPGENTVDFLSAVDSLGETDNAQAAVDAAAATVGICVTIAGL